MNLKIPMLAALCLLANLIVLAQPKVYSLEEVWLQTLQQYPSLTVKKENLERQRLQKQLVKKELLPEVNVQAQQSYGLYGSVPGSFFPLPGLYNTSGSNQTGAAQLQGSNIYASAVMQWNFLQFGRIGKKRQVAEAGIDLGEAALSQEAFRLQVAGTRHYFAALHATALLRLFQADARRLGDLMNLLKTQAEAGLLPGADSLMIKSAFLQAKTKVNEQRALQRTVLLQLASLMGIDESHIALDTSVYHGFHPVGISVNNNLADHPYLQYLKAGMEYVKAEGEVIEKELYPSVGLLAGAGVRGSGLDQSGTVNKSLAAPWNNNAGNYLVGVGVTWKLSSLYENKSRRRMADREVAAAKADYETARLQLQTTYAAAQESWKEQVQQVQAAKLALEASRQAYELYSVRYHHGLISLIELLQLQKDLQQAEHSYETAIYGYWKELMAQGEALGNASLILSAIHP